MLKLLPATLLGLALATGALAESATMTKPIQAGSLHDGPLDMVAYWMPVEDDGYELTATFIGRMPGDRPMRIVMRLEDGDDVTFAMPGYRSALYRFARDGAVVGATVQVRSDRVAFN